MRTGIEIEVSGDDRTRLEAIVADRNRPQKHVQRARIVLRSADGLGTLTIMRQVGCAKGDGMALAGAVLNRGRFFGEGRACSGVQTGARRVSGIRA
jgi:hypothetical protein